jgi:Mg2+/Co2+ transporter CorB
MIYEPWLAIPVILLLLVMSAFFSGAETAVTNASRARLAEMEKRGNERASRMMALTGSPEKLIATLLIGNTVCNVLAAVLAAVTLTKGYGDFGIWIASGVMVILVLFMGEVMPKTFAAANPDRTALSIARGVSVLVRIAGPVATALDTSARSLLKLFGAKLETDNRAVTVHEEIRGAIELHHKEGGVVSQDRDMLGGLLDLKNLEVLDVMVHRTKMVTLDISMPIENLISAVLQSGHTRLPVWKDTPESIVGILNAKRLFAELHKSGGDMAKINLAETLVDPWYVPDTRPLESQLAAFLRRKTHFALVVDEYGEVQGMITLEDIIEEIVGDIRDEFDTVVTGMRKDKDGSFVIDGSVALRDLNRAMEWSLPDDEATTVAGLVIHEAKTIPLQGESFTFHGFHFNIIKKRRQQLTSIRVQKVAVGEQISNTTES